MIGVLLWQEWLYPVFFEHSVHNEAVVCRRCLIKVSDFLNLLGHDVVFIPAHAKQSVD